ncbi:proline-rich proteoglycan 2-like [Fundulus heteroclitus]|uniref:proline-rich proteoglycan 2-like n=1 Tax=Fundulus heteroclitus TaxID=8078 RepID=UPI00165BD20F|nr:proline-rich proteoglycan 2-like [Fundulus heteroclitus]
MQGQTPRRAPAQIPSDIPPGARTHEAPPGPPPKGGTPQGPPDPPSGNTATSPSSLHLRLPAAGPAVTPVQQVFTLP